MIRCAIQLLMIESNNVDDWEQKVDDEEQQKWSLFVVPFNYWW